MLGTLSFSCFFHMFAGIGLSLNVAYAFEARMFVCCFVLLYAFLCIFEFARVMCFRASIISFVFVSSMEVASIHVRN